ncbi:MAG: ABC transporter ATP-binding protein [Pirellulales bacterium]|nr:ABC transporter ATP-binding protein [Pirellulales bacterium]
MSSSTGVRGQGPGTRGRRSEVKGQGTEVDYLVTSESRIPEPRTPNPESQIPKSPNPRTQDQLRATNIHKSYHKGPVEVPVLRGVDMEVRRGEFLSIVGQSGCGKSTLLHLLGTLDAPDRGEIHYDGRRIDNLPAAERDRLRNHQFGMIFQFYHLLPELNTLENVLAPLMIRHGTWSYLARRRQFKCKAKELLEMVGLGHRLKHRPRELSGGEMQRAAIARALVTKPCLLLADEPTGNLDTSTGEEIIHILRDLNDRRNLTIVMVTHDRSIARQADRIVRLVEGRIAE